MPVDGCDPDTGQHRTQDQLDELDPIVHQHRGMVIGLSDRSLPGGAAQSACSGLPARPTYAGDSDHRGPGHSDLFVAFSKIIEGYPRAARNPRGLVSVPWDREAEPGVEKRRHIIMSDQLC